MNRSTPWIAIALLLLLSACSQGGNRLVAGPIEGPDIIASRSTVEFSLAASANSVIKYNWNIDPPESGTFISNISRITKFKAADIQSDITATISVLVSSGNEGPISRSKVITIVYTENQQPTASAVISASENLYGDPVQFENLSTDPDGVDDIEKFEWDFEYDTLVGFSPDSTVADPSHIFPIPGSFDVQLRVTDSGGLSDTLDQPLVVEITDPPRPPVPEIHVASDFLHSQVVIQFVDNSSDPNYEDEIVKWEWDFSYNKQDGFNIESTQRNPRHKFGQPGNHYIMLRVTDSSGLIGLPVEPYVLQIANWGSVRSWGDTGNDMSGRIAIANDGRIYSAGLFTGTITLGNDKLFSAPQESDGYLASFVMDNEASIFDWWAIDLGPSSNLSTLEILNDGNILIGGRYANGFGPPGIGGFLRCYAPDKSLLWEKLQPGSDSTDGSTIVIDNYEYQSPIDTGGGNILVVEVGEKIHSSQVSHSADYSARLLKIRSSDGSEISSVQLDDDIGVARLVQSGDDVIIGFQKIYSTLYTYYYGAGVAKNDLSTLEKIWSNPIGNFVSLGDMASDPAGGFFISGSISERVDFDPGDGVYEIGEHSLYSGIYLASYTSDMNLNWLNYFAGDGGCTIGGMDINDGQVILCGNFIRKADFDPGENVDNIQKVGDRAAFLSSFKSDGTYNWTASWASAGQVSANDCGFTPDNGIAMSGDFSFSVNFLKDGVIPWTESSGATDAFIISVR